MATTISNARIFDGEQLIQANMVVIDRGIIKSISDGESGEGAIINAQGGTLLPGLIDSHVHTDLDGLRDALRFGVTTELEMMGHWTAEERREVAERDDIADVRSAGFGITPPGGHPDELMHGEPPPGHENDDEGDHTLPTVSTPEEAAVRVAELVASGSDYIKIMIEEGSVLGAPGLPMPTQAVIETTVREAHFHGKMAIAHTLTLATTEQAIRAGIDGLAHLFLDRPHLPEIVDAIAKSGAFVTPCLCLNLSIMGKSGAVLAADERVRTKLSKEWLDTLSSCFNTFPQGNFDDVLATVAALHKAGVDVLTGTDVSMPIPHLGGLAHGVSVHHELQLLVRAGFTPIEALRAATSVPARRFGLTDRGRVIPGARADLLLVDGDPTSNIGDTLSIRAVWRRGAQLNTI